MLPQNVTRNSSQLGSDRMEEAEGMDPLTTGGPGEVSSDHGTQVHLSSPSPCTAHTLWGLASGLRP